MKNPILRTMSAFGILVIAIMFIVFYPMAKTSQVTYSKPFFNHVKEIAVSDNHIYTLDDIFKYICKYTDTGEFQFAISFSSQGASYIYINQDGNLCRYDLKQCLEYVYDDNGIPEQTNPISYEEFDETIRHTQAVTKIEANGKTYRYSNWMLMNSTIDVRSDNNTLLHSFVVESFAFHVVWILIIGSFLSLFVFCFLQFGKFVISVSK